MVSIIAKKVVGMMLRVADRTSECGSPHCIVI